MPSQDSWPRVQKYLRLGKARQATPADLQTSPVRPDPLKYNKLTPARVVSFINEVLIIPAYAQALDDIPQIRDQPGYPRLLWQREFFHPSGPFYILKVESNENPALGFLTVKWRVGQDAFRYKLFPGTFVNQIPTVGKADWLIPPYTNQQCPQYVVFEFWVNYTVGWQDPLGLINDVKLTLSQLYVPNTPEELERPATIGARRSFGEMALAVGSSLPWDNSIQVYQDNFIP